MGVEDALGPTGGPGRKAKARGRVFRKLAPPLCRGMSRDERIIIMPDGIVVQIVRDRTNAFDHDDVANGRARRQDLRELRHEGPVYNDDGIGRAIDDIFEVRFEEAGIERVANGADAHDPIPAFEVPAAVHGHGGDAIARHDAER